MNVSKAIIYSGYVIFFILLCLSAFLYQERVFYIDSANQLFHMINEHQFTIFVERYSMALNQSLPMLFIYMGASVKSIALSYSVSFVLIHIACALTCWYVFKNIEATITIFTFLIMYRHAYFHAISETYLLIAYGSVFYAFLSYQAQKSISGIAFYSIAIPLIALNYFIHPVTIFVLLFSLIFVALYHKEYKNPRYYILFAIIFSIYLQKFLFPGHSHNESFFSELKNAPVILPDLLSSYPIFFITHRWNIYILPLVLMLLSMFFLFRKKYTLPLLFQVLFTGFFFLITAVTFHKGDSDMAMESRFGPLYFFIAIPLFAVIKDNYKTLAVVYSITLLMLAYSVLMICRTGMKEYNPRLIYLTNILNKAATDLPNKKYIVHENDLNKDLLYVKWGTSYETMLLTSIYDRKDCKTLFIEEGDSKTEDKAYTDPTCFLYTTWWSYRSTNELNKNRFNLGNDVYKRITPKELEGTLP